MLILVVAFSGTASAASVVYVADVGFDLDLISNDVNYEGQYTAYIVANPDAALIVDLEGYIFDANAFSNATEGLYANVLEFAQAQPAVIPSAAAVWNGQGTPGTTVANEFYVVSIL